jgi:uncharacterized protein (DUF2141 family)
MATLSVVVFKHGIVQSKATVQLNGPRGEQTLTTNMAGAVTFSALSSGRYIVNVAHGAEFLGNGFMELAAEQQGVIHIKFPKSSPTPVKTAKLTIQVHVYDGSTPVWPSSGRVHLSGPMDRNADLAFGAASFSDLTPGEYSISVLAVYLGQHLTGHAAVTLSAGENRQLVIPVFIIGTQPKVSCGYDFMTTAEIEKRINDLEAEISALEEKAQRQSGDDTQYKRECGKPVVDGSEGEKWNCRSRAVVDSGRQERYDKTVGEIKGKRAIVNALRDALRCMDNTSYNPTEI